MTEGSSILDIISNKPAKVKITIEDLPEYDYIQSVYSLYMKGDFDNMTVDIIKFSSGTLEFFVYLQYYLRLLWLPLAKTNKEFYMTMMNGEYRTIIDEYTKRII